MGDFVILFKINFFRSGATIAVFQINGKPEFWDLLMIIVISVIIKDIHSLIRGVGRMSSLQYLDDINIMIVFTSFSDKILNSSFDVISFL